MGTGFYSHTKEPATSMHCRCSPDSATRTTQVLVSGLRGDLLQGHHAVSLSREWYCTKDVCAFAPTIGHRHDATQRGHAEGTLPISGKYATFVLSFVAASGGVPRRAKRGFDSVAQLVEHIPFKDGVPGSSPG